MGNTPDRLTFLLSLLSLCCLLTGGAADSYFVATPFVYFTPAIFSNHNNNQRLTFEAAKVLYCNASARVGKSICCGCQSSVCVAQTLPSMSSNYSAALLTTVHRIARFPIATIDSLNAITVCSSQPAQNITITSEKDITLIPVTGENNTGITGGDSVAYSGFAYTGKSSGRKAFTVTICFDGTLCGRATVPIQIFKQATEPSITLFFSHFADAMLDMHINVIDILVNSVIEVKLKAVSGGNCELRKRTEALGGDASAMSFPAWTASDCTLSVSSPCSRVQVMIVCDKNKTTRSSLRTILQDTLLHLRNVIRGTQAEDGSNTDEVVNFQDYVMFSGLEFKSVAGGNGEQLHIPLTTNSESLSQSHSATTSTSISYFKPLPVPTLSPSSAAPTSYNHHDKSGGSSKSAATYKSTTFIVVVTVGGAITVCVLSMTLKYICFWSPSATSNKNSQQDEKKNSGCDSHNNNNNNNNSNNEASTLIGEDELRRRRRRRRRLRAAAEFERYNGETSTTEIFDTRDHYHISSHNKSKVTSPTNRKNNEQHYQLRPSSPAAKSLPPAHYLQSSVLQPRGRRLPMMHNTKLNFSKWKNMKGGVVIGGGPAGDDNSGEETPPDDDLFYTSDDTTSHNSSRSGRSDCSDAGARGSLTAGKRQPHHQNNNSQQQQQRTQRTNVFYVILASIHNPFKNRTSSKVTGGSQHISSRSPRKSNPERQPLEVMNNKDTAKVDGCDDDCELDDLNNMAARSHSPVGATTVTITDQTQSPLPLIVGDKNGVQVGVVEPEPDLKQLENNNDYTNGNRDRGDFSHRSSATSLSSLAKAQAGPEEATIVAIPLVDDPPAAAPPGPPEANNKSSETGVGCGGEQQQQQQQQQQEIDAIRDGSCLPQASQQQSCPLTEIGSKGKNAKQHFMSTWDDFKKGGVVFGGFKNMGNTCYASSVLVLLLSSEHFTVALRRTVRRLERDIDENAGRRGGEKRNAASSSSSRSNTNRASIVVARKAPFSAPLIESLLDISHEWRRAAKTILLWHDALAKEQLSESKKTSVTSPTTSTVNPLITFRNNDVNAVSAAATAAVSGLPARDAGQLSTFSKGLMTDRRVGALSATKIARTLEKKEMTKNRFFNRVQHDAQEFLITLLDALVSEVQAAAVSVALIQYINKKDQELFQRYVATSLEQMWRGELEVTTTCQRCRNVLRVVEPFSVLSLPLTAAATAKAARINQQNDENKRMSLDDLIAYITQEQRVEGYKCEKCHTASNDTQQSKQKQAEKKQQGASFLPAEEEIHLQQTKFRRLPKLLLVHLCRFRASEEWGEHSEQQPSPSRQYHKDLTPVEVPSALRLTSYRDREKQIVSDEETEIVVNCVNYRLHSIVSHSGVSLQQGHYYAEVIFHKHEGETQSPSSPPQIPRGNNDDDSAAKKLLRIVPQPTAEDVTLEYNDEHVFDITLQNKCLSKLEGPANDDDDKRQKAMTETGKNSFTTKHEQECYILCFERID